MHVLQIYNTLLIACRRKALPPGSPLFPLQHGLVLHKVPLLMLFVCGMVGDFLGYLLTVFVGFQLHMHLAALTVPFLPSDITTFMTSLHPKLIEHYLQPLTGVCLDIYAAVFFFFCFFLGGG